MAGAIIVIDQPGGAGAGSPGVARNDLWLNKQVNLSCATVNSLYQWDLLDVPPGSGATLTGGGTSTPHFLPDLIGTYRIQLITNGGGPGNVQILIIRVRYSAVGVLQNRGWSPPAYGEQSGEANYGGNSRGWAEEIEYIFADIRSSLTTLEASNTLVTWTSVRAALAAASSTVPFNGQVLTNFGDLDSAAGFNVLVNGSAVALFDSAGLGGLADPTSGSQYAATAHYVDNLLTIAISSLSSVYAPLSRTLTTTAPLRIDGGASANLSANRTLSIAAADGSNAGSQSSTHYSMLANATDAATASRLILRDASADAAIRRLTAARVIGASGLELYGSSSGTAGGVIVTGSYFGATSNGISGMDLSVTAAGAAMHLIANTAGINLTYGNGAGDSIRMTGDAITIASTDLGFRDAAAIPKATVTGSRAANAALASLLDALSALGLIADGTTA